MTNVIVAGEITAANSQVGALIGRSDGSITRAGAEAQVRGNWGVGGLVGANYGPLSLSYAIGSVEGRGRRVGGLVGRNHEPISNAYARVEVKADDWAGRLAGSNVSTIVEFYATGKVEGGNDTGGLVGYNEDDKGRMSASFWDIDASDQDTRQAAKARTLRRCIGFPHTGVSTGISRAFGAMTNVMTATRSCGGKTSGRRAGTLIDIHDDMETSEIHASR